MSENSNRRVISRKYQRPIYVSYSMYKCYKSCKEWFRQKYILKKQVTSDNEDYNGYHSAVGKAIQAVFENVINKGINYKDLDILFQKIDKDIINISNILYSDIDKINSMDRVVSIDGNTIIKEFEPTHIKSLSGGTLKSARIDFIREVISVYKNPLKTLLSTYDVKHISSEVKLSYLNKELNLNMNGILDFLIYDKASDSYIIFDGKRTYNPDYIDKEQLIFYKILVEKNYKKKVKKLGFIDFTTGETHLIKVTEKDVKEYLKDLSKFANDYSNIEKEQKCKIGYHCNWCPINNDCLVYSKKTVYDGKKLKYQKIKG